MTDREEKIFQKYTILEGWVKRAKKMALQPNKIKLKEAFSMIHAGLRVCEKLSELNGE